MIADKIGIDDVVVAYSAESPFVNPEPATMLLLSAGLIGIIGFRHKCKK